MILSFGPGEPAAPREAVVAQLGVPAGREVPASLERLLETAGGLFAERAAPAGVVEEVSAGEFAAVFRGEGRNEPRTPVAEIAPRAERLALFAVTLGEGLGEELSRLFAAEDFALAVTLDAMASVAADGAADVAERRYAARLRDGGWDAPDGAVLRYSPGYCGWDVTGQRALFARLRPERVGMSLTESCLMRPLKSVSGVLMAGPRTIHRFPPTYGFCERCAERTCRDRLAALFAGGRG